MTDERSPQGEAVAHKRLSLSENLNSQLPLVSVVIVNFNYAQFLRIALDSVLAQTYRNIEIVIVDDCSTDGSRALIAEFKAENPGIIVHLNEVNSGQGKSSQNGYLASHGAYVIFLDSDDYLLPTCVEAHVRVHLSLRMPVGLTSADMIQIVGEQIVTTTSQGFSEYVRSKKGLGHDLLRNFRVPFESSTPSIADLISKRSLHYVEPVAAKLWPWSPTSGNCFRRDALELLAHSERLAEIRHCSDIYFLRGVAAISGSVLIDEPLAVYRLHGGNGFIKNASLHRVRIFDAEYLARRSRPAMAALIDHVFDNFEEFSSKMESPHYLKEALETFDGSWPPIRPENAMPSYLQEKLIVHRDMLTRLLGQDFYYDWLLPKLLPQRLRRLKGRVVRTILIRIAALFVVPFVGWTIRRSTGTRPDAPARQ